MEASERIGVVVTGAAGRMGGEVVRTVLAQPDMVLVGAVDVHRGGEDAGLVAETGACDVRVTADLDPVLALPEAHVLVDFTRGPVAVANAMTAMAAGVACVIGTTGLDPAGLEIMGREAGERGVGVLLAPNFALGAVLMMRFAREAARYYEWAEIIERHHEKKVDAPSGTALRTAELMAEARRAAGGEFGQVDNEVEKSAGARGALVEGIRVHAVRSAGLLAHQEVMLGGPGEVLTIRHDSTARSSFMPGVMLAIRGIRSRRGLIVGLEHLLEPG